MTTAKYFIQNGNLKKISELEENKPGKTIYEVIKIINEKPLFIEDHYKRMKYSFKLNNLELEMKFDELVKEISTLVKENKRKEGNIKITYNVENKEFNIFFIKHSYPTKKMYEEGVDTILYFGERENPNAKVVNNDFRSKVNEQIKSRNAFEAILVDRNGIITEGSKSNIFIIKDGILYTSKIEKVLPGVTRTEIMSMAIEMNIKVEECDFNYVGLKDVDAMFISGTSPNILPIRKVEDIKMDVNNEILRKMMEQFTKKIKEYIKK